MKTIDPWQLYETVLSVRGLATEGDLQIVLSRNHQAKVMAARTPIVAARRTLQTSLKSAPNYD
jgi:hypothetical protein